MHNTKRHTMKLVYGKQIIINQWIPITKPWTLCTLCFCQRCCMNSIYLTYILYFWPINTNNYPFHTLDRLWEVNRGEKQPTCRIRPLLNLFIYFLNLILTNLTLCDGTPLGISSSNSSIFCKQIFKLIKSCYYCLVIGCFK